MPPDNRSTVGERLFWCYANLGMAEKATRDHAAEYTRQHFMIRAHLYKGLRTGSMAPRTFLRDQQIRMRLPQECIYCGSTERLSIDHIIPTNLGGEDGSDNSIWACRSCNSSKGAKDLFEWWTTCRNGMPTL